MYLKRNNIPKFWPIPRKGTKYLAVASHNPKESIPLVVVMREVLKLVKNKKELQRAINEKQVIINHKIVRNVNYPVSIFDVISLPLVKKNFKAELSEKKKLFFEEISDKEAETNIFKVLNKKIIPGKRIQLNLMNGININSNEKVNTGDSVVINLKDNKIVKVIPMEKGKEVFILKGKHAGNMGKIEEIILSGGKFIAKIISDDEEINVWIKNLIAIK
jgi:small subunit ribosomal protein S4e